MAARVPAEASEPMSHDPTLEDLDALVKKLMAQHDACLLTPRDYINAQSQDLRRHDQESGAKVFKVYDRIPNVEGMGS